MWKSKKFFLQIWCENKVTTGDSEFLKTAILNIFEAPNFDLGNLVKNQNWLRQSENFFKCDFAKIDFT